MSGESLFENLQERAPNDRHQWQHSLMPVTMVAFLSTRSQLPVAELTHVHSLDSRLSQLCGGNDQTDFKQRL